MEHYKSEAWLEQLKSLAVPDGDTENQHLQADNILCTALVELGYGELVDAWEAVPKWYA